MNDKQRQEVSLIGRILSIEALLLLMGIASLIYGITRGLVMNIFWGVVIIPGVFLLIKVRKRDWGKHWQDLEAAQQSMIERNRQSAQQKESDQKKEN